MQLGSFSRTPRNSTRALTLRRPSRRIHSCVTNHLHLHLPFAKPLYRSSLWIDDRKLEREDIKFERYVKKNRFDPNRLSGGCLIREVEWTAFNLET